MKNKADANGTYPVNILKPFQFRFPAWTDWFALPLMAIASPLDAALIHSYCVYESGIRLYNAQIGETGVGAIIRLVSFCCIPGFPTFLALLPFRRRALLRWLVWAGSIFVWTAILFQMEIAIR
jgi:hypothetical protein